jgi:hypothetical protein
MIIRTSIRSFSVALLLLSATCASSQQQPDPDANVSVEKPAHTDSHPRVAIDEAHNNFHTMGNRFSPFAKLMASDGCDVVANRGLFTAASLAKLEVLVIANAGGDDENQPMFTEAEINALERWVHRGGAVLLIADHAPYGRLAMDIGARFGVEMRNCFTVDEEHAASNSPSSHLAYTTKNGLLGDHPITRGRDETERIHRAVTYTGQSLSVPDKATAILKLGKNAVDRIYALKDGQPIVTDTPSAAGRAQILAIEHGDGRIVVGADAAMFTAQIVLRGDDEPFRVGFNRRNSDDRQLALNIMRWLTRAL